MSYIVYVRYNDRPNDWYGVKEYKTEKRALDSIRSIFNGETIIPPYCNNDMVKIWSNEGSISYYKKEVETA